MSSSPRTLKAEDSGDARRLTVYSDGSCPLCSAEIRHYAGRRGSENLLPGQTGSRLGSRRGDIEAEAEQDRPRPTEPTPLARLLLLANGARNPPPGRDRILLALAFGAAVHTLFAAAVLAMIAAMWFGMNASFGRVPQPWSWLANGLLLLQFPVAHSLLLTKQGERILARLVPGRHGATLSTTTYALIASAQLLALFALWTPTGTIWWEADGPMLWLIGAAYTASWMLLIKASYDAGAEVQSGALGWMSLMAARRPVFPDMPIDGMFRVIRQPIYVAFALTLWTVPVWTPDQLALAVSYTAYCVLAPRLKERRFAARYGDRFERYRAEVPYLVPRLARLRMPPDAQRSRDL